MGVVHLFGQKAEKENANSVPTPANCNYETGEVVELVVNARIAKGVPAKTVYKQMEALMVSHGVDFSCSKTEKDFKIISYLVQGIFDRQDGVLPVSHRSFLGETLRLVFEGETGTDVDETNELFGDLLGKL